MVDDGQLTQRQQAVLDFIKRHNDKNGVPPTVREIAAGMGFRSTNGVVDHVKALIKHGYLDKIPNRSRGIRLAGSPEVGIPILGRIAAGQPIFADQHVEGWFDANLVGLRDADDRFVLRVEGDSMVGAGIMAGDLIIVHRNREPLNGQIVAALIDDEATVKRFAREGEDVVLHPENTAYEPIVVRKNDSARLIILGVVTGVFRKLY